MRTQISDTNVYICIVRNNFFVIGESVLVVILWGVYSSQICFILFSSFPLVLFHYISDLGHVIGRCSAYLLTHSDSRRLSEIVSH